MRRVIVFSCVLVLLLAVLFLLGPRVAGDTNVNFDAARIGPDPDAYLAREEAKLTDIRPGQQKQIVWTTPERRRTPLAIVYVHGFSASSAEVRPLPDDVARTLGANLFFTRLTGHGRDGPAMQKGSVAAWMNDYAEAIAIGRLIGERVIVIATSTGGSLATVAADPALSRDVTGLVLISPNFGVQASGSFLLTMPWGGQIAELVIGKEHGFEPRVEGQEKYWTTRYPTTALPPMARLVELAYATRVEAIAVPALFIFSDKDRVVRPDLTRVIAQRWGGPHETLVVDQSGDPDMHVIAGDILSPSTTQAMVQSIAAWVRSLPQL